jgi:hypothetical protein
VNGRKISPLLIFECPDFPEVCSVDRSDFFRMSLVLYGTDVVPVEFESEVSRFHCSSANLCGIRCVLLQIA